MHSTQDTEGKIRFFLGHLRDEGFLDLCMFNYHWQKKTEPITAVIATMLATTCKKSERMRYITIDRGALYFVAYIVNNNSVLKSAGGELVSC